MLTDEQIKSIAAYSMNPATRVSESCRGAIEYAIREALEMNDNIFSPVNGPITIHDLATRLHNAGLSALECPKCQCGDIWHDYRKKVATALAKQ